MRPDRLFPKSPSNHRAAHATFALGSIGTATFGALILWALLGRARNA